MTFVCAEGVELPETAKVKLSTDQEFEVDSTVHLKDLTLKAGQALLLQFPAVHGLKMAPKD